MKRRWRRGKEGSEKKIKKGRYIDMAEQTSYSLVSQQRVCIYLLASMDVLNSS